MIWAIISGGIIGYLWGSVSERGDANGVVMEMVAGIFGASVGQTLFGNFGPIIMDMAVLPVLGGAAMMIAVATFIANRFSRS